MLWYASLKACFAAFSTVAFARDFLGQYASLQLPGSLKEVAVMTYCFIQACIFYFRYHYLLRCAFVLQYGSYCVDSYYMVHIVWILTVSFVLTQLFNSEVGADGVVFDSNIGLTPSPLGLIVWLFTVWFLTLDLHGAHFLPLEFISDHFIRLSMSTTQDLIVLDDSTFNPSMNQDDLMIGDEHVSNKDLLAYTKGGTTTTLNRHLENHCRKRKLVMKKQGLLNFQPDDSNVGSSEPGLAPAIVNGKYDHIRMRESIVHWILMHEHSFSIVEEAGFDFMMKVGIPQWPGLSRTTAKNDCVRVYENQKKKLKDMLKKVVSISLTTNMWKSKCQKIGYMVITCHFLDKDWKLNKWVLNFVHVPPPHRGIDISDALYKWQNEASPTQKSDLDVYFEDGCYMCAPEDSKKFNIFDWWKNHESKYRILSKLARDILAISITTVASEATFSAGSRVIDQYQAKLRVDTVQALLLQNFVRQNEASPTQKSDLDVYFEDGCYMCAPEDSKKFNILDWWKNHESKYRILSKLAHVILAIPITTVASEATFSAGSRVIDQYRAKLGVDTVHALLCGEDWMRNIHGVKSKKCQ
ncbi:putative zinc finger, BED-type containing protein, partial [Tanacetum coccineum]